MSKSTATLTSVFILSLMVSSAALAQSTTDPAAVGFPTSPTQLGGNGETGVGGAPGEGGDGGKNGAVNLRQHGWPGEPGDPGSPGGLGGAGGSGTWILQNMSPGSAFSNLGTVYVGGSAGMKGGKGDRGDFAGGRGGNGGGLFQSGQDGEDPQPDIWPGRVAGGQGGPVLGFGGDGRAGGGGGGGGGTGNGGDGGKGINGEFFGAGGSGSPGVSETEVTTTPLINEAFVYVGGNGGKGGVGGQAGSGGGGGGGGGAQFLPGFKPLPPGQGGEGGARGEGGEGGLGGDGGKGTIELRNSGRFINEGEGRVVIGRGGEAAEGALNVRLGGSLINKNQIEINDNGTLEVFFGGTVSNRSDATISNTGTFRNQGTIDNQGEIQSSSGFGNHGIFNNSGKVATGAGIDNTGSFINNGSVESTSGSFANFGAYTGSGTYLGTFVNHGVVAPGNSIGTAMIDGDFLNAVTLEVEIAGFGSGMHDFLDVSGTAAFVEGSLISFLPWEDYGFGDIAPQETKSLEFFHAAGGIATFLSAIAFGDGFLPDGFAYNVLNDGNSLFLEVSNNVPPVPLPPAIWLFISAILGFGLIARRKRGQGIGAVVSGG